jgi:integrase
MTSRRRNYGLRKVCGCGRSRWPKCRHSWHFSYKPRGGPRFRFSLNAEFGRHVSSKTEAEQLSIDLRSAIKAGTFRRGAESPAAQSPTSSAPVVFTLDQFAEVYIERASKASGKASWKDDAYLLSSVRGHRTADGRRLGEWALSAITEDELEVFHATQRKAGRAASTLNHLVQILQATFRWAARKGYLVRSPISDDSTLKRVKLARRTRRLILDEETALLSAAGAGNRDAGVRLSGLIVAAIETGCRRGELLGLQWIDVDTKMQELTIRAENTKNGADRMVPIATRLAAVLQMVDTDPAGRKYPPTAYVFGALGEPVKNIKKAWETCVLRAHGHEPTWTKGGRLSEESRTTLAGINLHFHDLRHEAGSRWLEAGMPLHHIKEILGHKNISQTDTYLNASRLETQASMRRFDAQRGKLVAKTPAIEQRPLRHDEAEETGKDHLH